MHKTVCLLVFLMFTIPQEHAAALTKAFVDRSVKAREALKSSSLRLPAPTLEWDVDYLLYSSHAGKVDNIFNSDAFYSVSNVYQYFNTWFKK